MTTACTTRSIRAHARAQPFCNMVAQEVLIYFLNHYSNICVSVLLLCCSYSFAEMKSTSAARVPLISVVSDAWSAINPTASDTLDISDVLQMRFDSFGSIYGNKIASPDSVSPIVIPALLSKDMKAGPDWLDKFFNQIKHKLEVSQTVSILLGDESLEDYGPNSQHDPIFCAGQRAAVIELTQLLSSINMRIKSGRPEELSVLIRLSQSVSLRYKAEIQRALLFFQRRRRALFEALASSIGGIDWGIMIIKKLEDSSHPH